MKKNFRKNWDPNPKKNEKKIFLHFFLFYLKTLQKFMLIANFQKSDPIFREEIIKMPKCRFSQISKNSRMSKSVLFFRNEIASISLQIRILRPKLGRHIFFGTFLTLGRSKIAFRETPYSSLRISYHKK